MDNVFFSEFVYSWNSFSSYFILFLDLAFFIDKTLPTDFVNFMCIVFTVNLAYLRIYTFYRVFGGQCISF